MVRPKKVQKVKEPIRIRQRKLTNGNMSLYLDVYVKGVRKVESLGLYLVPEVGLQSLLKAGATHTYGMGCTHPDALQQQEHHHQSLA